MKFLAVAAVALSSLGVVSAQKDEISRVNTCDPLVYADGNIYKSNDQTLKGFPAKNSFPVSVFLDEWGPGSSYKTAAKMRLVRVDSRAYRNWKLTRFEDSMTIPFSGNGPATFKHPSELPANEVNKYWVTDYGSIDFSEDAERLLQPNGGGFIWKKVDGYDLEQLYWDKATYDRAKADDSIQWGRLNVLCEGLSVDSWTGKLIDERSP